MARFRTRNGFGVRWKMAVHLLGPECWLIICVPSENQTGGIHMKITYTRVGDYYLPNLVAPESPKVGR